MKDYWGQGKFDGFSPLNSLERTVFFSIYWMKRILAERMVHRLIKAPQLCKVETACIYFSHVLGPTVEPNWLHYPYYLGPSTMRYSTKPQQTAPAGHPPTSPGPCIPHRLH
jgi:hypothetical protein